MASLEFASPRRFAPIRAAFRAPAPGGPVERFADQVKAGLRLLALVLATAAIGCSNRHSSPQPQEPAPSLEEAVGITRDYGEVLKKLRTNGDFLFGTVNLPEPKARIRAALFRLLDSVGAQKDADFLKAAVLRLAFFQDGVEGMAPLSAVAPDGRRYQEIVAAEVSELTLQLAQRGYGAPPP
jgi:hypothetical protein